MGIVRTLDGKRMTVPSVRGQLLVCEGCCCGDADKGNPPVPHDLMNDEWERRRLRNKVHLTFTGCLGPCAVANTVWLQLYGQSLWLHSMGDDPELVTALFDYVEHALAQPAVTAGGRLPALPPLLSTRRMRRFA